jgi:hypothetical protein
MRLLRLISFPTLGLIFALTGTACNDGPAEPESGFVSVTLQSPNGPEGGVVFLVKGDAPSRIVSPGGPLFTRQVADGTSVAVIRDPAGVLGFRMEIPDLGNPPDVEVVEVSGPDDVLRANLDLYSVEISR